MYRAFEVVFLLSLDVPCILNYKQPGYLLSRGRLTYGLSWAVEESLFSMAPKATKTNFTK